MQLGREQQEALEAALRGNQHIFLTGEAGVGKSHLIYEIKNILPDDMVACVAPTGIAAVNIGGTTIHSFCHIRDVINPRVHRLDSEEEMEAYEKIRVLIIDEVSMCRADLMGLMDLHLRMNGRVQGHPFGGVRLIMVGDPYQLPPVVTDADRERFGMDKSWQSPHFFDAGVWEDVGFRVIELKEKFRFDNDEWPDLLGRVRIGAASSADLQSLNVASGRKPDTDSTRLYARNAAVDAYNDKMLSSLPGTAQIYEAEIEGDVRESYRPTLEKLNLKQGARFICLRNGTDSDTGADYQNGSMGYVAYMDHDEVGVDLDNGNMISLKPTTWEIPSYDLDEHGNRKVIGVFKQIPLRLAWALTIHKAQGATLAKGHVDLGKGAFASGQAYVALSRMKSHDGLSLGREIKQKDIRVDRRVTTFFEKASDSGYWQKSSTVPF